MERIVVKTHEDLKATIARTLGFEPERSLVVGGVSGPGMWARIDIPSNPTETADMVEQMVRAYLTNRVGSVVVAMYAAQDADEHPLLCLTDALMQAGIDVLLVVHFAGTHVRTLGQEWEPLNTDSVPAAEAACIIGGLAAPAASRGDLHTELLHVRDDYVSSRSYLDAPGVSAQSAYDLIRGAMAVGSLDRDEARSLLANLHYTDVLNATTHALGSDRAGLAIAQQLMQFVDREDTRAAATIAGAVAYAAWRAGDGARAWIAHDYAKSFGESPMADLVADLLENAVDPRTVKLTAPEGVTI